MSETTVTRADLLWLEKFLDNYAYVQNAYPELFTNEDIEDFAIAKQIVQEKLDETT